ncbi:hypothetical protein ALQ89_100822 [Pseudomonas amygdali pv. tabaci]|uniref:Uncharacterized protein n=1 Tax=Pseudomonas amygdali pv. tabaci TaxID=322 RepID=A0AAX1W132_PSEAJ|nr:hypothetical protein ALQ89_100822 [Pseudomonas amygdali pv. tabaci]RMR90041.1 hypothetical protein ALP77_102119 [Pseudomonas amygdali pv. tabaci]
MFKVGTQGWPAGASKGRSFMMFLHYWVKQGMHDTTKGIVHTLRCG